KGAIAGVELSSTIERMASAGMIALLQSALSILTLVQANPTLPPATQEAAVQIARQAISQASVSMQSAAVLTSQTTSPTPTTQPLNLTRNLYRGMQGT